MIRAAALSTGLAALAGGAIAGPVLSVDPAPLAARLAGVQDFEALPLAPEPGFSYDTPITAPGLAIGERFSGQTVRGAPHDRLTGAPAAPLALAPAMPGAHLSTAYHPGFGSNALFPLGPDGFPTLSARGEGAVALLFEADIRALTLKLHADYADPLGARPAPGTVTLTFHARDGALIDRHEVAPEIAVNALGFRLDGNGPGIAGVTITNDDPGGIALDDIRYPRPGLGS